MSKKLQPELTRRSTSTLMIRGCQLALVVFAVSCGDSVKSPVVAGCDGGGGTCQAEAGADTLTGAGGRNASETGTGDVGVGGSTFADGDAASGGNTDGGATEVDQNSGGTTGMDSAGGDANDANDANDKDVAEIDQSQSRDVVGIDTFIAGLDGEMDTGRVRSRLEFRFLADREMTAKEAELLPLQSLVLDPDPLLELDQIASVRQSDRYCALYSDFDGDALLARVAARMGPQDNQPRFMLLQNHGLPFVVLADGERVFLSGFFSGGSSFGISGPEIFTDLITKDGFRFTAVMGSLNALDDPRIVKVLTDAGKLVTPD